MDVVVLLSCCSCSLLMLERSVVASNRTHDVDIQLKKCRTLVFELFQMIVQSNFYISATTSRTPCPRPQVRKSQHATRRKPARCT